MTIWVIGPHLLVSSALYAVGYLDMKVPQQINISIIEETHGLLVH